MSIHLLYAVTLLTLIGSVAQAQTTSAPSALTTSTELAPTRKKSSLKQTVLKAAGLEQSVQSVEQSFSSVSGLVTETLPDLGLKIKKTKKGMSDKMTKSKASKTEYEGLPMVKLYTKFGSGDREIVEEFYVLRGQQPGASPYIRDVFWYDQKNRRVTSAVIKEKENAVLLHGPYKRYQGGDLMEEGYYYAGMKDGRWEKYDSKFMLIDKARWQRGFPAEARITYHDSTHKKIKEVFPVEYGKLKGTYFAYHENGLLAEEGKYDNGVKIGRWTEFYPTTAVGRKRRTLTQHAADQWDTDFEPYVISEWDDTGKLIYERPKEKRVVAGDESEN